MVEGNDRKYTAAQVLLESIEKEFIDYRDGLIKRYKEETPFLLSDETVWENLCKCIEEGRVGGYDAITDIEDDCDGIIEAFSSLELKIFYLYALGFEHKLSSCEQGNLDALEDAAVLEEVRGLIRKKITNSLLLEAKKEISKK